ncbi:MAG: hypothetical protein BGO57_13105 [Sphingomonadales bacterium 63-6]|nr:MAG: hypothetical protein BGO57_13105 [Sphingomonadales bacterium 63-6]
MVSPFRRHQHQVLASLASAATIIAPDLAPDMPEEGPVAAEYRNLLGQLHEDLRKLHEIQSTEAKALEKEKMILAYLDWCQGALSIEEGQAAPQDEIVVTCLIWAIDIRNWPLALELADHVIRHNLKLPERFHRSPRALLWSELADFAIANPGEVPHDILLRAAPGDEPASDVKDETVARMHRAIGESWALLAENFDETADSAPAGGKPAMVDAALASLRRARQLDAKVGVKKQIEQLEREEKKLAAAAGQN